jgi:DNA-directed RNA polymerase specialized sigma24 family protein
VTGVGEQAERRPARAVARAKRSRRAAREEIAELYEEHVWGVYGFFGYRVASRADAEDLTQLTFERALRAWGRFDPERASARTWLISIANNLLIDHYRRDRTSGQEPLEVIALRFGGELTGPEIAELTGLSLANVQQILSRSLRKVRATLEEAGR